MSLSTAKIGKDLSARRRVVGSLSKHVTYLPNTFFCTKALTSLAVR